MTAQPGRDLALKRSTLVGPTLAAPNRRFLELPGQAP